MSSTDARCVALGYYTDHGRNLEEDMAALCANPQGVSVFTPQLVVLAKPVLAGSPWNWADLAESPAGADAWYIHLLCGDLRLAARLAMGLQVLELAVFQRGARSPKRHYCPWPRLLLRINH